MYIKQGYLTYNLIISMKADQNEFSSFFPLSQHAPGVSLLQHKHKEVCIPHYFLYLHYLL